MELNQVVYEVVVDDRQATVAAARAGAALEKAASSAGKLDDALERAATPWERLSNAATSSTRAVESSTRAWEGLNRRIDPTYRSMQEFAKAQDVANRAVATGVATHDEAARAIAQARQMYLGQTTAVNENTAAGFRNETMLGRLSGRMGNMGGIAQQAGYQISDLVTQISMGGNAMQAFAVQGGQMISMMGPWGAAVGAVVTVGGLLASTMFNVGDETENAKDALEDYESAIAISNQAMHSSAVLSRQLAQEKRQEAVETLEAAAATQADTLAKKMQALELQRQMAAEMRDRNQHLPGADQQQYMRDPINKTMGEIQDLEIGLADLQERIDALNNPAAGSELFGDLYSEQTARAAKGADLFAESLREVDERLQAYQEAADDMQKSMATPMVEYPQEVREDPETEAMIREALT